MSDLDHTSTVHIGKGREKGSKSVFWLTPKFIVNGFESKKSIQTSSKLKFCNFCDLQRALNEPIFAEEILIVFDADSITYLARYNQNLLRYIFSAEMHPEIFLT